MSSFTDFLKTIAPTAATLLGGPLAGMAVELLGSAMGVSEPTKEKIENIFMAGKMTSEQIAQVKMGEMALVAKLKELDIDLERIHGADRASARTLQAATQSIIPAVLATLITVGFFGILGGMMFGVLKVSGSEALLLLLGALAAAWGAVVNFYFGSSSGSEQKNALLAKK